MSQLFARVELRGTPGEDVYKRLHDFMHGNNWFQQIAGVQLPHATYQGTNPSEAPNLLGIANALKEEIEKTIWTKALVLVVRSADWGKSAG